MFFIYIFILYYASSLLPSVSTYVVLSANLNDFRSLAKKYVPNKNSVDQIKVMVLETNRKDKHRENFKEDELDRTIEYVGEEEDDYYEVQKPVYKQQLKKPPRVSLLDLQDPSPVKPIATQTVITVDDLVNELKHRILQEVTDKSGDRNVYTQANDAPAKEFETVVYKSVQNKPKSLIKNTVPLKIFKEEVQFGGTYEDAIEQDAEPQIQYLGQIQIPAEYFKGKPVKDKTLTKKVIPKKHRFKSPKHFKPAKKVGYVQQLLLPSKSKQRPTEYALDPSLIKLILQQPSLGQKVSLGQHTSLTQQPNTVKPSIIEPQLTLMQQSNELKLPLDQQPSIVQHMALMKQQIDRLNKIVEQLLAKPSTTTEAPQENIEAVEAPFEVVLNQNSKEDEQKTTDSTEVKVQEEEDSLTEEITAEPVLTETTTKPQSVPTTEENEQFIETNVENEQFIETKEVEESVKHEEHTPGTVENDETAPEKGTEAPSNDVEEAVTNTATTVAEAILVQSDTIPRLKETPKIHTQEFGNPAAGEPIVEKTYNFNAPVAETKAPVNLKLPVGSARKVLLF